MVTKSEQWAGKTTAIRLASLGIMGLIEGFREAPQTNYFLNIFALSKEMVLSSRFIFVFINKDCFYKKETIVIEQVLGTIFL